MASINLNDSSFLYTIPQLIWHLKSSTNHKDYGRVIWLLQHKRFRELESGKARAGGADDGGKIGSAEIVSMSRELEKLKKEKAGLEESLGKCEIEFLELKKVVKNEREVVEVLRKEKMGIEESLGKREIEILGLKKVVKREREMVEELQERLEECREEVLELKIEKKDVVNEMLKKHEMEIGELLVKAGMLEKMEEVKNKAVVEREEMKKRNLVLSEEVRVHESCGELRKKFEREKRKREAAEAWMNRLKGQKEMAEASMCRLRVR